MGDLDDYYDEPDDDQQPDIPEGMPSPEELLKHLTDGMASALAKTGEQVKLPNGDVVAVVMPNAMPSRFSSLTHPPTPEQVHAIKIEQDKKIAEAMRRIEEGEEFSMQDRAQMAAFLLANDKLLKRAQSLVN